jgi:hypothetical protein
VPLPPGADNIVGTPVSFPAGIVVVGAPGPRGPAGADGAGGSSLPSGITITSGFGTIEVASDSGLDLSAHGTARLREATTGANISVLPSGDIKFAPGTGQDIIFADHTGTQIAAIQDDGTLVGFGAAPEAARHVGALGQPAFESGWANYGDPFEQVTFYKDAGRVYMQGQVSGGSDDSILFTLPAGYRPARRLIIGGVIVWADGSVVIHSSWPVGGFYNVNNISFLAA